MMSVLQIKNFVDWSKLFGVMEYGENPNAEEIKQIILENLSTDLKNSNIVNSTVDYYLETQSTICLEIMSGVRDQHEKHLFDKLNECVKAPATRTMSISLIGQLIKKQPSWLPRIVNNPVLTSLFRILKNETNILNICNGIFTIVMLLPTVPSFIKPHLPDIFEIFSRLVVYYVKPGNLPQVHRLHLSVTLFEMFSRLYGMYPCHLIAYLRQCMNNKEKRRALLDGLKPMMLQVKLHPSLVTDQKDHEISMERWKKMEPHDVIVECAKMSVENTETTREDNLCSMSFLQQSINTGLTGANSDSFQNSQTILSPSVSLNADNVASTSNQLNSSLKLSMMNNTGLINSSAHNQIATAAMSSQNGIFWNSGIISDMSTPPPTPHNLSNSCSELTSSVTALSTTDSPLCDGKNDSSASNIKKTSEDATPEIPNNSGYFRNKNYYAQASNGSSRPSTPLNKENIFQFPPSSPDIAYTCTTPTFSENRSSELDKKFMKPSPILHNTEKAAASNIDISQESVDINDSRDDAADKEVENINHKIMQDNGFDTATNSDLTSSNRNSRIDSSTPKFAAPDTPSKFFDNDSSNFQASIECSADQSDPQCASKITKNMNRLRFFSQCTPTINTPKTLRRRKSCSDLCSNSIFGENKTRGISNESTDSRKLSLPMTSISTHLLPAVASFVRPQSESIPNSCFYVPSPQLTTQELATDNSNFAEGMTTSLSNEPCHSQTTSTVSSCQTVSEAQRATFPVKPIEILEHYLSLGSDIHCNTVPLTSSKLTDWTHFGGQPPRDEIEILRDQIQLFQYQLIYERYKREIHAQRNRRLLCKAKDAKVLKEQNIAMKDQLELQEKEVQHLRNQAKEFQKQIQALNVKENDENDILLIKLRDLTKENENLKFSNSKLKELLVSHTDENNKLKEELKYVKGQCFNYEKDIGIMQEHITYNSRLKSQIDTLNQELMLMGELHQRYREKYSYPTSNQKSVYNYDLFQEVADNELSELKRSIEEKEIILQAHKARTAELENALSKKDAVIAEHKLLLERTNLSHVEKLEAVESKYTAMRKICQDLQLHVQELNDQLEVQKRPLEEIKERHEPRYVQLPRGIEAIEAIKYDEENEQELLDRSPVSSDCETDKCQSNIHENLTINTSAEKLSNSEPLQDGAGHQVLNSDDDTPIVSSKDNGEI